MYAFCRWIRILASQYITTTVMNKKNMDKPVTIFQCECRMPIFASLNIKEPEYMNENSCAPWEDLCVRSFEVREPKSQNARKYWVL